MLSVHTSATSHSPPLGCFPSTLLDARVYFVYAVLRFFIAFWNTRCSRFIREKCIPVPCIVYVRLRRHSKMLVFGVFLLLLGICSFFGSDKSARLGWLTLNHVARYLRKSFDFGKICFGTHLYATTWKSPRKDTIDKREIDKERHNSWTEKKNQRTHKYIWSRCRTKCASMQQQQHPRFNFETGFSSLFPVIARSPALGSQSLCLSLVLNSRIVFAYCVGWFFFRALYLLQILWGIVYIITRIISFRVGLNVHKFIHNKYVALLHVFIGSCNFDLDVSNFLPSTHTKSHICCWLSSSSSSLKWYLRFAIEIHRIMQRTWTVLVL